MAQVTDHKKANYDRFSKWYDLLAGRSERMYIEMGVRTLDVKVGEVARDRLWQRTCEHDTYQQDE
jgi:hypothetical protein